MRKRFLLWATVSLCSCSVQRTATSSLGVAEERTEAVTAAAETRVQQTARQQTDTDEEVVTTTEEFDTSRPADPQTGTPPLKRRTTTHRQQRTATAAAAERSESAAQTAAANLAETVRTQHAASEQTERKAGTHALVWWLLGALAAMGAAALRIRSKPF